MSLRIMSRSYRSKLFKTQNMHVVQPGHLQLSLEVTKRTLTRRFSIRSSATAEKQCVTLGALKMQRQKCSDRNEGPKKNEG